MTVPLSPKVLLCVLDGFGYGPAYAGNAIENARAPFLKHLMATVPWNLLRASGEDVGIPAGTQGGSEVGHLTMGAGRIVRQPLEEIDFAIESGEFFQKTALLEAAALAKQRGSAFHILGMISDQGVHADLDHALALLDFAKAQGLERVYVHGITDGRDVPPKSVEGFVASLDAKMKSLQCGQWADLVGRFYAMDRDKNLDRTEVAYALYTRGMGVRGEVAERVPARAPDGTATARIEPEDLMAAVRAQYARGVESDYYLEPLVCSDASRIQDGDVVIFFNFRTDRAAQLTERFLNPKDGEPVVHFVAFGPYTKAAPVVFPEPKVVNNLGAILEAAGRTQLRIAETEKYAHVTFFFNSQVKEAFAHETRILVDSPKCPSYAEQPEMSARGITEALIHELQQARVSEQNPSGKAYDFVALNFANLDLVGHSGSYAATVQAMETLDECLAQLVPAANAAGYTVLITGDHGNAEYMLYDSAVDAAAPVELKGQGCPSHTRNPVPFIVCAPGNLDRALLRDVQAAQASLATPELHSATELNALTAGGLRDVAPTILHLMGVAQPAEMTGTSLVG